MVSSVEVTYPHDGGVGEGQLQLSRVDGAARASFQTTVEGVVVYSDRSRRAVLPAGESSISPVVDEAEFWLVPPGSALRPARVELDRPSEWAGDRHRADYLIISHASLIEAVEPLAEFHRSRGLAVEIVDVQDLFDEFNGGIVHPVAIRRFLGHAYERWEPRPRYVLLVGDASWDVRNTTVDDSRYANWADRQLLAREAFVSKEVSQYEDFVGRDRNLVPAATFHGFDGHSASDNWYVRLDGDDALPEMAIGRFPVVSPGEVAAIVEKTIRYAESSPVGPWRRSILWITNEEPMFQARTDRLVGTMAELGFADVKIYPSAEESSNELHQTGIVRAIDSGQYLIHFVGHGGRFIWRTGPPDLEKNPCSCFRF